jgi:hypothetical protein
VFRSAGAGPVVVFYGLGLGAASSTAGRLGLGDGTWSREPGKHLNGTAAFYCLRKAICEPQAQERQGRSMRHARP